MNMCIGIGLGIGIYMFMDIDICMSMGLGIGVFGCVWVYMGINGYVLVWIGIY